MYVHKEKLLYVIPYGTFKVVQTIQTNTTQIVCFQKTNVYGTPIIMLDTRNYLFRIGKHCVY